MKLVCTGRKVSLKEQFVERVNKRMAKLDKFFSDSAEAQVTVTVEKDWQTVEITIKDKGFTSRAEKDAERMEEAFDAAADRREPSRASVSARRGQIGSVVESTGPAAPPSESVPCTAASFRPAYRAATRDVCPASSRGRDTS